MDSLVFTSGKKEKIPVLLTGVACNYFLASFLAKHIVMVLLNRGVKPDRSSNCNYAGFLSPAGLEFFCDNLFSLKNPLIIQSQA